MPQPVPNPSTLPSFRREGDAWVLRGQSDGLPLVVTARPDDLGWGYEVLVGGECVDAKVGCAADEIGGLRRAYDEAQRYASLAEWPAWPLSTWPIPGGAA